MKPVIILGISAYFHDSAAAIISNGRIVAAAQEERFTRIKGDASFPHNAINYCLKSCKISVDDVDYIVFYENPSEKFERILVSLHLAVPKSIVQFIHAIPEWITDKLWMEQSIQKELGIKRKQILFSRHHVSHAASAFFPSPYKKAAILTIDGVGEWSTASFGIGEGNKLTMLKEMRYPNSLGLLYSAFTIYTGFKINSGEYKLMGLAPYGEPIYADTIKNHLIHINEDGSINMNQKYFNYTFGIKTINKNFEKLFGKPARLPEAEITKHDMDIAASIQSVTNEIIIKMAKYLQQETNCRNIVLAGGVALNVTAMGKLIREEIFNNVWIQPAAGDAGGALGAALHVYYDILNNERSISNTDSMDYALLGPEISESPSKVNQENLSFGGNYTIIKGVEGAATIARLIAEGNVVGIAKGKMEFGPRALGNRSILCDARNSEAQVKLNMKIKFRESFRPFAPIVLENDASEYFNISCPSPYMLFSFPVKEQRRLPFENDTNDIMKTVRAPRSDIPAVTHIDYSARVQTVNENSNPFLHSILMKFKEYTGCSVLINTSFNVRGEPIVNTAEEAYRCFMKTDMDYVLIGDHLFKKADQPIYTEKKTKTNKGLRGEALD